MLVRKEDGVEKDSHYRVVVTPDSVTSVGGGRVAVFSLFRKHWRQNCKSLD